MIIIIFLTPGPNTQEYISYVDDFMFQVMLIYRNLTSCKATYSHCFISLYKLCTKEFRVFGSQ